MKKGSIFAKIIYYLFVFSFGIILAIFLPFIFMYDGEALNTMQDQLDAGNYTEAMGMVGGYYNKNIVLNASFDAGGGIVLFEAATLYEYEYKPEEQDAEVKKDYKMHKSYAGFVYGISEDFSLGELAENKAKLLIGTLGGQKEYGILNADNNGDEVFDCISSLLTNNFFFLELAEEQMSELGVTEINSLTLIKADGGIYGEVQINNSAFNSENFFKTQFFKDVESFIQKNNEFAEYSVRRTEESTYEKEIEALSIELGSLNNKLLTNENYAKSNSVVAKSRADKRASRVVVIYFICAYVIGDFLLGTRYILKFIKWFGSRVLKIKPKEKPIDKSVYGTSYYSQVEFKLETVNFKEEDEIELTYSNETERVTFTLNGANGYTQTQRMKAGAYSLQPSDLQERYDTEFIPATIVAEGYKKAIEAKIIRREEERA